MGIRFVVSTATLPVDARELKDAAQELVDRRILPDEVEISMTGEVPDAITTTLKELGYYGLTVPLEYGGLGLDHLSYCAVLEEFARAEAGLEHRQRRQRRRVQAVSEGPVLTSRRRPFCPARGRRADSLDHRDRAGRGLRRAGAAHLRAPG